MPWLVSGRGLRKTTPLCQTGGGGWSGFLLVWFGFLNGHSTDRVAAPSCRLCNCADESGIHLCLHFFLFFMLCP